MNSTITHPILSYFERTCELCYLVNGFGTGNITYNTHDLSCLVLAMLLITFLQARKCNRNVNL